MQRELNVRIKGRESFRPFAPAVLWERAADWFDLDHLPVLPNRISIARRLIDATIAQIRSEKALTT